jgi:hypothetical protein
VAIDPVLQYDSAMMAKLRESPEWQVFLKYVGNLREGAMAQMTNPQMADQMTHHFRGVYTACLDLARTPDDVIAMERYQRERDK